MSGSISRLVALLFCGALVTDQGVEHVRYFVHTPAGLAPGAQHAVEDLRRDLSRLTGEPVRRRGLPAPACVAGEVHLLVLGHQHDPQGKVRSTATLPGPQEYLIDEQRCRRGRRVVHVGRIAAGRAVGGLRSIAAAGCPLFPSRADVSTPATRAGRPSRSQVRARPAFQRRSMHVHRDHPVELSAPQRPEPADRWRPCSGAGSTGT